MLRGSRRRAGPEWTRLALCLALCLAVETAICTGRAEAGQPGAALYPRVIDAGEMAMFYSYDTTTPLSPRLTLEQENMWYRRYELTYMSEGDTVYAAYFEPKRSGRVPAIVGVHGMFSETEDQFWFVADFAAKRGFAVVMPSLPYHHRRAKGLQVVSGQKFVVARPETIRGNFRRAVVDMRRALDWLVSRPNVAADHVYITGASLGGIVSTLVYKAEPRFAGGVFLVSGGSFVDILAHSDTPLVRDFRLISRLGVTDLDSTAQALTMVDPVALPDLWPRPVLMLNATEDVIFPVGDVSRLAAALHKPQIVWAKSSHYYPVAGAQYLMTDFLARLAGTALAAEAPLGRDPSGDLWCRETMLAPAIGDSRLWIEVCLDAAVPDDSTRGARGARGNPRPLSARFGIHLVNRLTPTLVVSRTAWEAHRPALERVPASIFVADGDTIEDLGFALSYVKLLDRGRGGAYVVCGAKPDAAGDHVVAVCLDPLGLEVAWATASAMTSSGLGSAGVLDGSGLRFENVGDVTDYFRERIRVAELPPIPALPDDEMLDISWAEPAF